MMALVLAFMTAVTTLPVPVPGTALGSRKGVNWNSLRDVLHQDNENKPNSAGLAC